MPEHLYFKLGKIIWLAVLLLQNKETNFNGDCMTRFPRH